MTLRYYEALFIVHPNYEQDRLNAVADKVENEILKRDGVMINKIDWGKRRLAYPIEKQKYGNYILLHFEANPLIISEVSSWMKIQSTILSQIIIKLDEKPDIIEKDSMKTLNEKNIVETPVVSEDNSNEAEKKEVTEEKVSETE